MWPTEQVLSTCLWLKGVASQAPAGSDLRIVVAGATRTIHHLVNAIERLRREDAMDLCVCIYLVPVAEENALADCIARTACWYCSQRDLPCGFSLPGTDFVGFVAGMAGMWLSHGQPCFQLFRMYDHRIRLRWSRSRSRSRSTHHPADSRRLHRAWQCAPSFRTMFAMQAIAWK